MPPLKTGSAQRDEAHTLVTLLNTLTVASAPAYPSRA